MKFRLIEEERSHHSVSRMARVLGVTAAGYHAWRKRVPCARRLEDERLKGRIAHHFEASHGTYGSPASSMTWPTRESASVASASPA